MPRRPTIDTLLKRIEATPQDAALYQQLGSRYLEKGLREEAKSALDRSLELEPSDPWTHLYLGNWHYRIDNREAVKCFKRAVLLMPNDAIGFVCLGDAYAALGFDALATENYRHALDMAPDDKIAKRNWQRWLKTAEREED